MEIRRLTDSDSREHNKVSSQAYVYGCDIDSNAHLSDRIVIGAFEGEHLMADMAVTEAENFFGGNLLSCAGVGGVASKPEYRNRGAVRRLFEELFNGELLGKKYDISILYPFSEAYYRKFGYEIMAKNLELSVPFKELGTAPKNSDVELFDGTQTEELLRLYNAAASRFNLAFKRDDSGRFPSNPYASSNYTYMWKNADGEYRSLATFKIDRPNRIIRVSEIYWLDRESLAGILGFLRCFEGNQDTVIFEKLTVTSPVLSFISNERQIRQLGLNMGCGRIIDVESVLNKKRYPDEHGSFTVRIEGDTVAENNAAFSIEYENGKAEVKKTDKEADVVLEPIAASKIILTGIGGAETLAYTNGAKQLNYNKDFYRAFPVENTFFVDGF